MLFSAEGLKGSLLASQELDMWLVGTIQALQENMRDVQGRLKSLESMPGPPKQVSPSKNQSKIGAELLRISILSSSSIHICLCPHVSTCLYPCLLKGMV